MNVKNNRLVRETNEKIVRAVYEMMVQEHRPVGKITVREICEKANIHRSTFYSHYLDVYDVVEKVEESMSRQLTESFFQKMDEKASARECFTEIFTFIRTYREFYTFYLNEGRNFGVLQLTKDMILERYKESGSSPQTFGAHTTEEMEYHGTYLVYGLTAVVRMWLKNNCREEPEALYDLILRQSAVQEAMIGW